MRVSRLLRRIGAAVIGVATGFVALLPPPHIHLAEHHHHGHSAAVEHSHWTPHQRSGTAFDDDDGVTLFVDHPAVTSGNDVALERPAAAVIALLVLVGPGDFTPAERLLSGNSPRDGPSRAVQPLRAPPAFDTL